MTNSTVWGHKLSSHTDCKHPTAYTVIPKSIFILRVVCLNLSRGNSSNTVRGRKTEALVFFTTLEQILISTAWGSVSWCAQTLLPLGILEKQQPSLCSPAFMNEPWMSEVPGFKTRDKKQWEVRVLLLPQVLEVSLLLHMLLSLMPGSASHKLH